MNSYNFDLKELICLFKKNLVQCMYENLYPHPFKKIKGVKSKFLYIVMWSIHVYKQRRLVELITSKQNFIHSPLDIYLMCTSK